MTNEPPRVRDPAAERRRGPRVPLSIWVEQKAGPGVLFRRAGNLSLGGIFLEVAVPQPVGTLVELELKVPGDEQPMRIQGVVVGTDEDTPGMSVRFVDVPIPLQERLVRCITAACDPADPPPEP